MASIQTSPGPQLSVLMPVQNEEINIEIMI
jgi:hypothetical protein